MLEVKDTFDIELELLVQAIFLKYHSDFRHYSRSSLKRRLRHAMERLSCETLTSVQQRVLHDPAFFAQLLDYLTVPTTELFRDPEYFLAVREHVVPLLKTYPSVRIWIAGCSTGEELYSMAILLREEGLLARAILYATDINPGYLEVARKGIYSRDHIRKATQQYLKSGGRGSLADYFSAAYGNVRFDPGLIENAVLSDHSLATDTVFAEVHFVSCRNVLIYFGKALQDRAIGLFKESLIRKGFLGLGSRETVRFSGHAASFEPVAPLQHIFRRC